MMIRNPRAGHSLTYQLRHRSRIAACGSGIGVDEGVGIRADASLREVDRMLTTHSDMPFFCTMDPELYTRDDGDVNGELKKDMEGGGEWGDPRQETVFIGISLDHAALETLLNECLLNHEEGKIWQSIMCYDDASIISKKLALLLIHIVISGVYHTLGLGPSVLRGLDSRPKNALTTSAGVTANVQLPIIETNASYQLTKTGERTQRFRLTPCCPCQHRLARD